MWVQAQAAAMSVCKQGQTREDSASDYKTGNVQSNRFVPGLELSSCSFRNFGLPGASGLATQQGVGGEDGVSHYVFTNGPFCFSH